MVNKTLIDVPVSSYFETAVVLDDKNPINWKDFHYRQLMDRPVLGSAVIRTSRQVGKSIYNSLTTLKFAHVPSFRTIYMCPSQKQAEEFSKLKLGKILTVNQELKHLLLDRRSPIAIARNMRATEILNDVYIKSFATGSSLKIGYASDEAGVEKVRGGSADMLIKDEAQSMLLDLIDPILDPMLFSSAYKIDITTGTPLDPDDDLCKRFDDTTMHTMVVKCHHCNKYTLLDDLRQISKKGILCKHCWKPIDVRTGKFYPMNPYATKLGFHFNQIMMPGVVYNPFRYQELLDVVYSTNRNDDKLYAERLGIPKGSSVSLMTRQEVQRCKSPQIRYSPESDFNRAVAKYRPKAGHYPVLGIDWGGGANDRAGGDTDGKSHTAIVFVDFYMRGEHLHMDVLYHKIYPLPKVRESIDEVLDHVRNLPDRTLICPDFMGGAYANSTIFDIIDKTPLSKRKALPVRFAQMKSLVEAKPDSYRVDVDRSFIISKFVKKKIIDRKLNLPHNDMAFNELMSSIMSMKSLTNKRDPGQILWVLKKNKSNDIFMALVAAWVGFCVDRGLQRDILL